MKKILILLLIMFTYYGIQAQNDVIGRYARSQSLLTIKPADTFLETRPANYNWKFDFGRWENNIEYNWTWSTEYNWDQNIEYNWDYNNYNWDYDLYYDIFPIFNITHNKEYWDKLDGTVPLDVFK